MSSSSFPQSAPLTYSLASLGGVLEVFATAILAYPDAREKQGIKVSTTMQRLALAGNVVFQILASLAGNLFATWFGPVSLVGPIFFSAQLVANMIIFGFVLGLENLNREMQVGTYVIVVATVLLPIVGPGIQEGQNAQDLLSKGYSIVWSIVLVGGMLGSAVFVFGVTKWTKIGSFQMRIKIIILLIARSTCFTLNLTASRVFILEPGLELMIASVAIKVVSGAIYTWAIVVQSTEVVQSQFVPLNATCLMLLNAITGVIIWEDWRVVESWVGYVCVFLLLALASYLLLSSAPLMTSENPEYGQKAHFSRRRQLRRSVAIRSMNIADLGHMSDHSEHGEGESDTSESVDGDKSEEDKAGASDGEEDKIDAEKENVANPNEVTEDSEPPIESTEEVPAANDIEAPATVESSRPGLTRHMSQREAWQSICHLPVPPRGSSQRQI